jgi:cobalt-zinc-cadmium efflux system membrane fusion protein
MIARWLALAAIAILAAGCGEGAGAPAAAARTTPPVVEPGVVTIPAGSPQLALLKVGPVGVADVPQNDVVAPARVVIDPNRVAKVLLPVPGRIVDVMARLGDHVEQGQPVVAVESPEADAAAGGARQADAAERQAEATLAKAEGDHQRTRELLDHGAVAQKDLLAAQNDRAQALAALEAARVGREQARRRLEMLGLTASGFRQRVLVRAPISGKVLEVGVAAGEYRNDTSAALMTVAELSRVWVSAEVPEPAIRFVRPGHAAAITLVAFPGRTFAGRVTRIADVVDPQTRTVKVHSELANPDGQLRPDMFGTVRYAGPSQRIPVVPITALVQQYGRPVLFVERGAGAFERREVDLGSRVGEGVAIARGVAPGDRVVVDGAVLLKDR